MKNVILENCPHCGAIKTGRKRYSCGTDRAGNRSELCNLRKFQQDKTTLELVNEQFKHLAEMSKKDILHQEELAKLRKEHQEELAKLKK